MQFVIVNNDIIFTDNDFEAYISTKNLKNTSVTQELLEKLLQKYKVIYGIDKDRLQNLLYLTKKGEASEEKYLIAKGTKPIDGCDGDLLIIGDSYEEDNKIRNYHYINERIDFRYYQQFKPLFVDSGDIIGFYTPPTKGSFGVNVKGNTIKAKDGSDVNFNLGENVYIQNNKIYSKAKGILNYKSEGSHIYINVENVLVIDSNIDYSTGNIQFPGTIVIKGDIMPSFEVVSGKDIYVDGINSATAKAEGDIIVTNGITGGKLDNKYSNVKAKGIIKARFIQFSNVESDNKIIASKHIIHSNLYSNDKIELTGFPGSLIGGKLIALNGIIANRMGTKINIPTLLSIGVNYKDHITYQNLLLELKKLSSQLDKIYYFIGEKHQMVSKVNQRLEEIKQKKFFLEEKINTLNNEIERIKKRIKNRTNVKIEACVEVWPNVSININNIIYITEKKSGSGYFQLDATKNKIIFVDTKY